MTADSAEAEAKGRVTLDRCRAEVMARAAAATVEVEMAVVEMVVEMAVARAEEVMVAGTASDLRRARAAVLVTAPGPILAHLTRCALGTRPLTAGGRGLSYRTLPFEPVAKGDRYVMCLKRGDAKEPRYLRVCNLQS